MPVSATSKRYGLGLVAAFVLRRLRVTDPASVNFTALPIRLISTCRSFRSSPVTRRPAELPVRCIDVRFAGQALLLATLAEHGGQFPTSPHRSNAAGC